MSVQITGKIDKKGFGMGTWALVSDSGEVYELKNAPADLKKKGLAVTVTGTIRNDLMTVAMIGPVLEVESFS